MPDLEDWEAKCKLVPVRPASALATHRVAARGWFSKKPP